MVGGVAEALAGEGHEVDSPAALLPILATLVAAGRVQELEPGTFAPNDLDPDFIRAFGAWRAFPEAIHGLEGPPPETKAEGAIWVLLSDMDRGWTTQEIGDVLVGLGWMADTESSRASLTSTLSRLVAEGKIHRPKRGHYQLPPHVEETG